jgi:hypothetical protein
MKNAALLRGALVAPISGTFGRPSSARFEPDADELIVANSDRLCEFLAEFKHVFLVTTLFFAQ